MRGSEYNHRSGNMLKSCGGKSDSREGRREADDRPDFPLLARAACRHLKTYREVPKITTRAFFVF